MALEIEIVSRKGAALPVAMLVLAASETLHRKRSYGSVEIMVVGDQKMRRINRESLQHDYTTDVLSWDLGGAGTKANPAMIQLVICLPYARREARARGITVEEELVRYVIHGCLHAIGYDDHQEADRKRMWAAQEKIVKRVMQAGEA